MKILTQRIYADKPLKGYRVLVDRLWPRGIKKEKAMLDSWNKDIAPSDGLRKWFHHEEKNWPEFHRKYLAELRHNKAVTAFLAEVLKQKSPLILLYGAKNEEQNQAVVLREYLEKLMEEEDAIHCASPTCYADKMKD